MNGNVVRTVQFWRSTVNLDEVVREIIEGRRSRVIL